MFGRLVAFATFSLALAQGALASNSKRGLTWSQGSNNTGDISVAENTQVSWTYDWGQTVPDYLKNSGLTYIPMQWGSSGIEGFQAAVQAQGAKTVLGFNEPDFSSQSNLAPAQAASLWEQYIQPLKADGVALGGPAVTAAPSGIPWLQQFLGNCTSCTFDFIPLHWYGDGVGNFYNYIWEFHGEFPSYPIWVTEFASTSTNVTEVNSFCNASIAYMDSLDWIQGYSWFAFFRDDGTSYYNLLDASGKPNALGTTYLTSTIVDPPS
ncbi:hypothetical protein CONPUDRAFT_162621 [Coniophora puteana RWD-64-598 SS2]|uniref:Asl1-like glycosyl hydrolase catalytic domain-containing protein n=1 Tax=Coniophora puteana (strain RWD-64-598) TaxID=741705 RepID=A0A5M3N203_CONPW|nr:uncharacterized protein CONPUDRAFT_162621 [Coniophora puteana RWD-64-598 SS2]EIW85422.1 hypothetical protein CONPUDRAFT_162621 [Coniophora puteana RWD-64-598 SS2]